MPSSEPADFTVHVLPTPHCPARVGKKATGGPLQVGQPGVLSWNCRAKEAGLGLLGLLGLRHCQLLRLWATWCPEHAAGRAEQPRPASLTNPEKPGVVAWAVVPGQCQAGAWSLSSGCWGSVSVWLLAPGSCARAPSPGQCAHHPHTATGSSALGGGVCLPMAPAGALSLSDKGYYAVTGHPAFSPTLLKDS